MKKYNRVMLGPGGCYANQAREEGWIGADFDIHGDLTGKLPVNWREFNEKYIPVYQAAMPEKSRTAAGLSCGFLWTICKGLEIGDVVLCPSGDGTYYVGIINGDYYYMPGEKLPHRRSVQWMDVVIPRKTMSEKLRNSTSSIGTCCDITRYSEELEALIAGGEYAPVTPTTPAAVKPRKDFLERDLHPLFCTALHDNGIIAKTLYHEKSLMSKDPSQKWVHPDIIAAKFAEYKNDETFSLLKATEPRETVEILSFEMKRRIESDGQLKEYYFQAVSNSSWANKGYLVAFEIEESLRPEIERLNNDFGIGVILMSATGYEVMCPARENKINYDTIDKLANINREFRDFVRQLTKVMMASKDYAMDAQHSFIKSCDKVFETDEEIVAYCKNKNIPY